MAKPGRKMESKVSPASADHRRQVRAQASAWIARLHADGRSDADVAAFQAWLAQDPLHQEIFDQSTSIWEIAGTQAWPPARAKRPSRRMVMMGAGAGIAVVGSLLGLGVANAGVSRTGVGEQKKVSLSDGSSVLLDTDTEIRCHFTRALRSAVVAKGRASFELVTAPAPFLVRAGSSELHGQAAAVDVSAIPGAGCIYLSKGQAVLSRRKGDRLVLQPGERALLEQGAGRAQPDRPDPDKVLAWHSGRVVFENESVAAAAAEMNRYSQDKIRIEDPSLASMPVSGVYRAGDSQGFVRSLSILFSAQVETRPGLLVLKKKQRV